MRDARRDARKYEGQQLFVYLQGRDKENLLVIEEGTGDNLLNDDIENGFVDYVNYYSSTMQILADDPESPEAEIAPEDGGMILFRQPVQNLSIGQIIHATLEDFLYPHDAVLLKGGTL